MAAENPFPIVRLVLADTCRACFANSLLLRVVKKTITYAKTQFNDALIESCRAGNEAPALNRNGELETMLNLGLKAIDTPFTEPFCALGTSKCSYTTISGSPDNTPYPKALVSNIGIVR